MFQADLSHSYGFWLPCEVNIRLNDFLNSSSSWWRTANTPLTSSLPSSPPPPPHLPSYPPTPTSSPHLFSPLLDCGVHDRKQLYDILVGCRLVIMKRGDPWWRWATTTSLPRAVRYTGWRQSAWITKATSERRQGVSGLPAGNAPSRG